MKKQNQSTPNIISEHPNPIKRPEVYFTYSNLNGPPFKCRKCHSNLRPSETVIPLGSEVIEVVKGMRCENCGAMHVESSLKFKALLEASDRNWKYEIDNCKNPRKRTVTSEKESQFWNKDHIITCFCPSSTILKMTIVPLSGGKEKSCYIVLEKNQADEKKMIFHYSEFEAREILTASCYPMRRKHGTLGGRLFKVIDSKCLSKNQSLLDDLRPKKLIIGSTGGLFISEQEKRGEVVDMLVYGALTKRYEIMRATYCKNADYAFVDVRLFREYIAKYGRPDIPFHLSSQTNLTSANFYDNLNSESILHIYGYNLSDGASETWRQNLLAELIDLELLSQKRIISYLETFINFHQDIKFIHAREEWNKDLKFVLNYKANPKRFLIAKS